MSKEGLELAARCTWSCGMEDERDKILLKFIKKEKGLSIKKVTEVLEKTRPFPWYQFIAWLEKIDDPFDLKVVELFWKPNESSKEARKEDFEKFLSESEMPEPEQNYLLSLIPGDSFYPCHNFLILSDFDGKNLKIVDNCKLTAGRVTRAEETSFEVSYPKLAYDEKTKNLSLIRAEEKKWIDKGLTKNIHEQEVVIFHYNSARDRGNDQEMSSIWRATERAIELFNKGSK